jgi:hypothetical protein
VEFEPTDDQRLSLFQLSFEDEMPMAASRTRQLPAVIFYFLNHISCFQSRTFSNLGKD